MRHSFRLIFTAVILSQLIGIGPVKAAAASLAISPGSKALNVNDNLDVDIKVNSGGQAIGAVKADVSYSNLAYVSGTGSGSVFDLEATAPAPSNNHLYLERLNTGNGYTGNSGQVYHLKFKVTAAGTATITINQSDSSLLASTAETPNVLSSVAGGSYTVKTAITASPTAKVTPKTAASITALPAPAIAVASPLPSDEPTPLPIASPKLVPQSSLWDSLSALSIGGGVTIVDFSILLTLAIFVVAIGALSGVVMHLYRELRAARAMLNQPRSPTNRP